MQNSGVGHVHFMVFVLISFALGSQREPLFQWNMDFKPIFHCNAKPLALGSHVGLDHRPRYDVIYTNMLVSKNAKPCRPNANPGVPNANPGVPTTNPRVPNTSQWNIVCGGYARAGFVLGM